MQTESARIQWHIHCSILQRMQLIAGSTTAMSY